ncbi:MAG TPA: M14 family zinc carboxypeptidase [Actinomycetota bacterium]|nr:M14 family zinc carboxypeptidase [Actinomycetota bacterium]
MRTHRRTVIAVLSTALIVAGLVGPAAAHYRKADGKRVTKKHARMHRTQDSAAQTATVDLAPSGAVASSGGLRVFSATVDGSTLQELVSEGYDATPLRASIRGTRVALVLSGGERKALEAKGISLTFQSSGRESTDANAALANTSEFGWKVFRSYDEAGGIEDQLQDIGSNPAYDDFVELVDIGDTIQERDIWAIRMTDGVAAVDPGDRPAVLYQGTTHAREWISTEVTMRLLRWFLDEATGGNAEVADLLGDSELWFLPVVNPDGYEYTFTTERLWRKNLRDNNGDEMITNIDGVDLNRNYAEHWNYDEEGSSSQFSSETYRGTGAESEPEVFADANLIRTMGDFKFAISYHSFGQLLLYPQGWQTLTATADDPIYLALTGIDTDPAVPGFNPGVGADLYTTNGEFTDWAHGEEGVLAWTPELSEGCKNCTFEFPDNNGKIQHEFEDNLDFALNVARSAVDPDDPASHWGMDTAGLYLNTAAIDPWKTNWPQSDLRVPISYGGGSTQPVEVLAKKDIGAVTLNYRKNNGSPTSVLAAPSPNGGVYGGNNAYNTYYQYLRAEIPVSQGDTIEYWFSAGGESTEHVTFQVVDDADADVLIVAAEDRTGASTTPLYATTTSPNFLSYYTDAITASGRTYDIYDVDARGRTAPDHLGVLGHYDAVIWYTGNDFVTREPGLPAGNVSRLAVDMVLTMRQYLNEGGALAYTGQRAGSVENGLAGDQLYDPVANQQCVRNLNTILARCLLWSDKNDFLQYYLGAYIYNSLGDPGTETEVEGLDVPYSGMSWFLNGADSANNQNHHASFITTSSILPATTYPWFTSDARANYVAAGPNPFEPFDGDWYVYSQQADISYKRLMRSFTVPAGGGEMTFRFSYDTEPDWDFVFVEIHDVAADTWATAPDLNGNTSSSTGESCPEGWHELHPWLVQYQQSSCSGAGWNAASGRSDGWEQWRIDLTPYAGKDIEISISYASDWAIQGLGAFVDSVQLPGDPTAESFEGGLGAWTMPGAPAGSDPNPNDWERRTAVGFEEGSIVSQTPTTANFKTLYFGFGFEAIRGADIRRDVMNATLTFLGV